MVCESNINAMSIVSGIQGFSNKGLAQQAHELLQQSKGDTATEFDTQHPPPLNKGIPTYNLWEFTIFRHKNFRKFLVIGNAPPQCIICSSVD